MRVLILGGYGSFGARLARLLADEAELTLVIAGRSAAKAAAFCGAFAGRAKAIALGFDRDGDVGRQLRAAAPDLVVDASGPFQAYGAQPYRVVEACIALGIHYLDLADGAGFVNEIARFDAAARARGIFALSGASTLPALTAAVVRRLARGIDRVEEVRAGIAPSPRAALGVNVVRAIASYAGKPIAPARNGARRRRHALIDSLRFTIRPPGRVPLRPRRFTLIDAPDREALPALWPELRTVWVGAGTVPASLHRLLSALAWLVRLRLAPSLAPLAPLFHRAMRTLRWGEHRGGMFVTVAGRDRAGGRVERAWHLVAEGDDGPFIPVMAAAALVRRVLAGAAPAPGARPATRELELDAFEALFAGRRFASALREGRGRRDGLLTERFGPFAFAIALVLDGATLRYVVRGWSLFGLPLPHAWAPGGATTESAADGRFQFDVEIRHPLLGLIVRYRGWLAPRAGLAEAPARTNPQREAGMTESASAPRAESGAIIVCYNSACPVCRAGMERYQRIAAASARPLPLGWRDINVAPELFRRHGISFDMAMRRLYAFDGERMLRGIDVIVAIWRRLPGWRRWLGAVAGFRLVRPLAWFAYEALVSYPIYRWSRARWRRRAARQAGAS
jgi:predicted DCC family thiol-disulfide oxidoreductase YuxK